MDSRDNCSHATLASIIIPVFNLEAGYLERCLASILSQTYPEIDVVVVDDGSRASLAADYDALSKRFPKMRLFHKKNGGVSSARNVGLEKATGELVMFVDADDELASADVLERAVNLLERNGADVAYGGYIVRFEDSQRQSDYGLSGEEGTMLLQGKSLAGLEDFFLSYARPLGAGIPPTLGRGPWGKLFRKVSIGSVRFDEGITVFEDGIFNGEVVRNCETVVIDDSPWYIYYQYAASAFHAFGLSDYGTHARAASAHFNSESAAWCSHRCKYIVEAAEQDAVRGELTLSKIAGFFGRNDIRSLFQKQISMGYEVSSWRRLFVLCIRKRLYPGIRSLLKMKRAKAVSRTDKLIVKP
ncbi:glycosyltransferase family 2 protein [Adlercreutzia murintestinalis]|uniref:glycosyltransferase family 2 protein n=1 Tax=Adlercreutzia murintestinalis TaxID=2941325 RepID=UPI00203BDF8E|nr:glycosyltransferase family 2 protein [Adlercreutzia murintestinalis]